MLRIPCKQLPLKRFLAAAIKKKSKFVKGLALGKTGPGSWPELEQNSLAVARGATAAPLTE